MSQETQNFANHTRWHVPYHFVLGPIMLLHFLYMAYLLYRHPDFVHAEALLLAVGLVLLTLLVRVNPLRAQDRVIRLEERLRYQRLLPADLAERAGQLPEPFIIALRFASDAELPELARQALETKFEKPADLKQAIKQWRGDYFRV